MGDVVAWSGLTLAAAELTYFSFWLSRSAPVAVKTLSFWGSDGFFYHTGWLDCPGGQTMSAANQFYSLAA